MIIQGTFIRQVPVSPSGLKFSTFRDLCLHPETPAVYTKKTGARTPFPFHSYHPLPGNSPLDRHRNNLKFRTAQQTAMGGLGLLPGRRGPGEWPFRWPLSKVPQPQNLGAQPAWGAPGQDPPPPAPFTCLSPGFKAPPSVPWESKSRRLQLSDLSLKKLRPCSQSWEQTTGRWGAVVWSFVFTAGRVNQSRLKAYLTGEKFLLSRSFQELLSINQSWERGLKGKGVVLKPC